MKKIYLLSAIACIMLSCTKQEKLTVYDLEPFKPCHPCKVVTAIKSDDVKINIVIGDTVLVNLEDSEITRAIKEDRYLFENYTKVYSKVENKYNYRVTKVYQIDKEK